MTNKIDSLVGKVIAGAYWDGETLYLYTGDDEMYVCPTTVHSRGSVSYKGGGSEFIEGVENLCYSEVVDVTIGYYNKHKGFWSSYGTLTIKTEKGTFEVGVSRYNYRAYESEHEFDVLIGENTKVYANAEAYKMLSDVQHCEIWKDSDKYW